MWHWHLQTAEKNAGIWQIRCETIPNSVISQNASSKKIEIDIYCDKEEQALLLQACYGGTLQMMQDIDWVAHTAPEKLAPLLIRQQLVISQSEQAESLQALQKKYPKRQILSFPAERAFGTGDHATTSTCLRLLCDFAKEKKNQNWTLCDIGCGTGVLAIAGRVLGASYALGLDFDHNAVEVAQRNQQRNHITEELDIIQADIFEWAPQEGKQADLVLANLFSIVLQAAFPRIIAAMKPDGQLIISGILRQQLEETLDKAKESGLCVQSCIQRGKWATALLSLPQ